MLTTPPSHSHMHCWFASFFSFFARLSAREQRRFEGLNGSFAFVASVQTMCGNRGTLTCAGAAALFTPFFIILFY